MDQRLFVLGTLALTAAATKAAALPTYEILPLGLTDAEHQFSSARQLTGSGYVIGSSMRYGPGQAYAGQSEWLFDPTTRTTTRLGYFDAAHTDDAGYQSSFAERVTESGHAFGSSTRFLPGDSDGESSGTSAWGYDAHSGTTTRLGYFDAAHTRNDGNQQSHVIDVNESGHALGTSNRWGAASAQGFSSWLYDASSGATTRLGFLDPAHTQFDGFQDSRASMLTESGYVIGTSSRFPPSLGVYSKSAWLYDAGSGTTTQVGLLDALHTRSDGFQYSLPTFVTESGDVIGSASRFGGLFNGGQSAWYYDSATGSTSRAGLLDAAHTRSDGYQFSSAELATESGYAGGRSSQYAGSVEGLSAWLFDSTTGASSRLGFVDADHTHSDGSQVSHLRDLTESGHAIGVSYRYSGATGGDFGSAQSTWIYDAQSATTTRLGYFDGAHTRSDGYQFSSPTFATDSGYVTGYSARFNGGTGVGTAVWLYDAGASTTARLGYFDAAHTRNDGLQSSSALELTESGYVAGRSRRYSGSTSLGDTSWIYRAGDQTQYSIVLSERSDGYADSFIRYLGEDGLALGSYELFAADDTSLGDRAFAWTPDDGAFDLGALVVGGLPAAGWDALASAIRANGLTQILGSGVLEGGGTLAYLLVAVPEPGTGLLVAVGIAVLTAQRRRTLRDAA